MSDVIAKRRKHSEIFRFHDRRIPQSISYIDFVVRNWKNEVLVMQKNLEILFCLLLEVTVHGRNVS